MCQLKTYSVAHSREESKKQTRTNTHIQMRARSECGEWRTGDVQFTVDFPEIAKRKNSRLYRLVLYIKIRVGPPIFCAIAHILIAVAVSWYRNRTLQSNACVQTRQIYIYMRCANRLGVFYSVHALAIHTHTCEHANTNTGRPLICVGREEGTVKIIIHEILLERCLAWACVCMCAIRK